jgi:hypothetical protein
MQLLASLRSRFAILSDKRVNPEFLIFRNSLDAFPDSGIYTSLSCPTEGRIRIVRDAGRDAVDVAALGVKWDGRAGFGLSRGP